MRSNLLFVLSIMSFAFGTYIGLCDSQACFFFIALGIVLALFSIRSRQLS